MAEPERAPAPRIGLRDVDPVDVLACNTGDVHVRRTADSPRTRRARCTDPFRLRHLA